MEEKANHKNKMCIFPWSVINNINEEKFEKNGRYLHFNWPASTKKKKKKKKTQTNKQTDKQTNKLH